MNIITKRILSALLATLAAVSLAACAQPGSAYVGTWVGLGSHHDVAVISRHGSIFAAQQIGHAEIDYYHLDSEGDLTDGLVVGTIDSSTGDLVLHSPFGTETMKRGHPLSRAAMLALAARRQAKQKSLGDWLTAPVKLPPY